MEETLNYQETMGLIETFMEDSGLRDFCTKVCEGKCCKDCIIKCPPRKLSCGIYLCATITRVLFPDELFRIKYYKLRELIIEEIKAHANSIGIYYRGVPKKVLNDFSLSKNEFIELYPTIEEYQAILRRANAMIKFYDEISKRSKNHGNNLH